MNPKAPIVAVACTLAALLAVPTGANAAGAAKDYATAGLKTARPSAQALDGFFAAVKELAEARKTAAGKPLPDIAQREAKLRALAGPVKHEWRTFAKRLKDGGEAAAFDRGFEEYLESKGERTALTELRAAGGATAIFANPDAWIDGAIEQMSGKSSNAPTALLLHLIGISTADAAVSIGSACVLLLKAASYVDSRYSITEFQVWACGRSTVY